MKFDEKFWTTRYKQNQLGWDTGTITTPLKTYIDQLINKDVSILIPGCGNGYEAKYLHDQGFTNVTVIDLSDEPLKLLRDYCHQWSDERFITGNFFDLEDRYDLIIEQTFFCALDPKLRMAYSKKMHALLNGGGKLIGLLFNVSLGIDSPPFGGDKDEYLTYFNDSFNVAILQPCYNSIKPRAGSELFMKLIKPM